MSNSIKFFIFEDRKMKEYKVYELKKDESSSKDRYMFTFVRKLDVFKSLTFSDKTKNDIANDTKYDEITELFDTDLYNKIKINDEG